jgi:hypothetical protein
MIDGVVWLPSRAPRLGVPQHLAASAGDLVTIGSAAELMSAEPFDELRTALVETRPSTGSGRIAEVDEDTEASE